MPFSQLLPTLKERQAVTASAITSVETGPMTAAKRSEVFVSYDSEGAAFQNAVGGYQIGTDGTIHAVKLLFNRVNSTSYDPAKSTILDGKGPLAGGETVSLGTLDAGEKFGLFLISDGWNLNPLLKGDVSALQFRFVKAGTTSTPAKVTDTAPPDLQVYSGGTWVTLNGDVFHTADNNSSDGNKNLLNDGGRLQALGGRDAQGHDSIAFEDIRTGRTSSDRDFNDAVFDIRLEQRLAPPTTPTLKDRIDCIEENTAGPIKVGLLSSKDPDGGSVVFKEYNASFEIRNGKELWYTGPALDYETDADKLIKVTVTAVDDEGQKTSKTFNIQICDEDETTPPTTPALDPAGDGCIPEALNFTGEGNSPDGYLVGTLSSQDTDSVGPTGVTFSETSTQFEVRNGNELWYVGGPLDHETTQSLKVTVMATDNEGETANSELTIDVCDEISADADCASLFDPKFGQPDGYFGTDYAIGTDDRDVFSAAGSSDPDIFVLGGGADEVDAGGGDDLIEDDLFSDPAGPDAIAYNLNGGGGTDILCFEGDLDLRGVGGTGTDSPPPDINNVEVYVLHGAHTLTLAVADDAEGSWTGLEGPGGRINDIDEHSSPYDLSDGYGNLKTIFVLGGSSANVRLDVDDADDIVAGPETVTYTIGAVSFTFDSYEIESPTGNNVRLCVQQAVGFDTSTDLI